MSYKKVCFSKPIVLIISLGVVFASTTAGFADVRLAAIISDNMVLQQGKETPIWGWAEPGERVVVWSSWQAKGWGATADKDGKWIVKIRPPKARGPYTITIKGRNTINVSNVLCGEVWVCSGQSNMRWKVRNSANPEQEMAAANYPEIRLFTVERKVAEQPESDCVGSWQLCSPNTVPDFSAVAYFFGRELHKELKVPIGLIHSSWGGTPAEAWTKREVLESEPDFSPILERYANAVARYPKTKKEYEQKVVEWEQIAAKARTEGREPSRRPKLPYGPGHPHSPSGLYNAMVAPLMPCAMAGVIWYQGESNAPRAYQYRRLFPVMIQNWRNDWGRGDFPFLFVQLANFNAEALGWPGQSWAELREAQLMSLALANTGMAVTIDIGDANDIHPKNKQDVGKRLALWALAKTYGRKLEYCGPIYKSMNVEDDKIVLRFEHTGSGLVAGGDEPLKGFTVAGSDRKFVSADAKVVGNTVVVSSKTISRPVAVRYGWANNPVCSLYNKEGLPASPFRTDDWPGVTVDKK